MRAWARKRLALRILLVALITTVATVVPFGAAAHAIPPYWLCDSEDDLDNPPIVEFISANSSDYILWECRRGPYFGYYWQITGIGNAEEDAYEFEENWIKFLFGQVAQGLVDVGIGLIDTDGNPTNDNLDAVVSFTLHGPSGSPIFRTLGARIIVGYSSTGPSGPFTACSDTGWRTSNPDVSAFSTKLQYGNGGKCGSGWYRVQGAGQYKSVATGQWEKTGWVFASTQGLFMSGAV
jgi:hypothetical protein